MLTFQLPELVEEDKVGVLSPRGKENCVSNLDFPFLDVTLTVEPDRVVRLTDRAKYIKNLAQGSGDRSNRTEVVARFVAQNAMNLPLSPF